MPPSILSESDSLSANRLARAWLALAFAGTGLIVLGAGVRAFEAGLACPDWPLCFGEVIPEMNLEVGFEFSHRVLAGCISLVFVFLGVRTWPIKAMRRNIVVIGGLDIVSIGLYIVFLLPLNAGERRGTKRC